MDLCILCGKNPPIQKSHIIPKFAYKRMKDQSSVKTLRHSGKPHHPIQDGAQGPYLCSDCEAKFNSWETPFCNLLLDRYEAMLDASKPAEIKPIPYTEWLPRFLSSVHFRYLKYIELMNPGNRNVPDGLLKLLEESCNEPEPLPGGLCHYLWFLHPIRFIKSGLPPGINAYYFFSTDGYAFDWNLPDGGKIACSFVKLPSFALLSCTQELPVLPASKHIVDASQIGKSGVLDPRVPEDVLLMMLGDDFRVRVQHMLQQESRIPDKQMKKIEAEIAGDSDCLSKKRHKIYLLDRQLLSQHQAAGGK
jgi:hypothetical protein